MLPPATLAGSFDSLVASSNVDKAIPIQEDIAIHKSMISTQPSKSVLVNSSSVPVSTTDEVMSEVPDKDGAEEANDLGFEMTDRQPSSLVMTETSSKPVSSEAILPTDKDSVEGASDLGDESPQQPDDEVLPEISSEPVSSEPIPPIDKVRDEKPDKDSVEGASDLGDESPQQPGDKVLPEISSEPVSSEQMEPTFEVITEIPNKNNTQVTKDLSNDDAGSSGDISTETSSETKGGPVISEMSDNDSTEGAGAIDLGDETTDVQSNSEILTETSTEPTNLGDEGAQGNAVETSQTLSSCVPTIAGNRYTDNGDGTVTDNTTCLVWLKDSDCLDKQNWADASIKIDELNSGKDFTCDDYTAGVFNDWRLPTVQELQSVVHYDFYNPVISNAEGTKKWGSIPATDAFTSIQLSHYWSSTTNALAVTHAWNIRLNDGATNSSDKSRSKNYVWPVRAGQVVNK